MATVCGALVCGVIAKEKIINFVKNDSVYTGI
jgi:hypothetical protein